MNLTSMDCPKCGGQITMDMTGRDFVFCPYCGAQVAVTDENVKTLNINHHITEEKINHAKLAELEYKEREDKRNTKLFVIIMIAMLAPAAIGLTWYYLHPRYAANQLKKHTEIAAEQGLLSAGNASDYKEQDWKTVRKKLEDLGFTNISHTKEGGFHPIAAGDVTDVSINGISNFGVDDYFAPDAPVNISHY